MNIPETFTITDDCFYLVIMHDSFRHSFVQHLLIPLLESFGLRDLLIGRVTMEDVVIPFAGWARPDMTSGVAGEGNT